MYRYIGCALAHYGYETNVSATVRRGAPYSVVFSGVSRLKTLWGWLFLTEQCFDRAICAQEVEAARVEIDALAVM